MVPVVGEDEVGDFVAACLGDGRVGTVDPRADLVHAQRTARPVLGERQLERMRAKGRMVHGRRLADGEGAESVARWLVSVR